VADNVRLGKEEEEALRCKGHDDNDNDGYRGGGGRGRWRGGWRGRGKKGKRFV
jgi:hypothetical protein